MAKSKKRRAGSEVEKLLCPGASDKETARREYHSGLDRAALSRYDGDRSQ